MTNTPNPGPTLSWVSMLLNPNMVALVSLVSKNDNLALSLDHDVSPDLYSFAAAVLITIRCSSAFTRICVVYAALWISSVR